MSRDLLTRYLDIQLAELENAQLIQPAFEQDRAYLFNHVLTQESAYESLLLKERREIHRLVADACERLYSDRLDENAALIAQHYRQAGDDAKTFAYSVRAGDAAARVFAFPEAGVHYAQALDALMRLPETQERQVERADTLLRLVSVSLRAQGPVATLKRLAEAERLARPLAEREGATREDRLRLGRVRYWQGQALIHQNETRAAIRQLQQALSVAQVENDPALLAMPASVMGRTLVAQGRFAQALPILTDAQWALKVIHDDHEWILATGFRGVALTLQGDFAAGITEAERALAHATEANTLTGMAFAHGALGMVYFFGGAGPQGDAHAHAMIELAARSGDRLYAYIAYGFLAWSQGRAGKCVEAGKFFAQADAIAQAIGGQLLFADWFGAARAEYTLRCGRAERALTLAATVSQRAQRNASVFVEGLAERTRGQALAELSTPRIDGAEVHLGTSLAKLNEAGARLEAARTRISLAQVILRGGHKPSAREQLEQAAAQFRASGLDRELREAQHLIESLPT